MKLRYLTLWVEYGEHKVIRAMWLILFQSYRWWHRSLRLLERKGHRRAIHVSEIGMMDPVLGILNQHIESLPPM